MHRLMLVGVLALAPVSLPLRAQSPLPVRAGSAVRIETSTNRVFRGTLLDGSADSIRLRQAIPDSTIAVPSGVVRTYSVLHADRRHGAKRGFLIGGGVALGLAAVLTAANANDDASAVPIGLLLAIPAALLGSGLGAGIGAALTTPEWGPPVVLHASGRGRLSLEVGYRF